MAARPRGRWRGLAAALALLGAGALAGAGAPGVRAAERLPIFDVHVHYSAPDWDAYDPAAIAAKLAAAGVPRALVSSSPDEGTRRLVRHDPRRFLAELRPYRAGVGAANWTRDAATPDYLRQRLAASPSVGIGEFHLHSEAEARSAVVREVAALAARRKLWLHVHSGDAPLVALFAQQPGLRILWAHAGMTTPPSVVGPMLEQYPHLVAELSFRAGDILRDGRLDPAWQALLIGFSERILIGSDTYLSERWDAYGELIEAHRHWLALLPPAAARAIAYGNAVRLFGAGGAAFPAP